MLFAIRAMQGNIMYQAVLKKGEDMQFMALYWAIARLKLAPYALPENRLLLIKTILLAIIVDIVATRILRPDLPTAEVINLVSSYNILMLLAVALLLYLTGYRVRILQSLTALAGSGVMISLVLLPGLLTIYSFGQETKSYGLFILIDYVWRIAVTAHIFRYTFSVGSLMAMILSVSYMIFGMYVGSFLMPASG